MSESMEWFGVGQITERLNWFHTLLGVHGLRVQFNETDNVAACKTLHHWMLQLNQMPTEFNNIKSSTKSKELRVQGNKIFGRKKKLADALELYNKAICWAERGEDLALGFANRSAVYFQWKLYDLCMENINLAVAAGCPGIVLPKLERRRADCIAQLQNDSAGQRASYGRETSGPATVHLHCEVITDRRKFQASRYAFDINQKRTEPALSLPVNPLIPFIANCLELKLNPKRGRHVVTKQDLKPGQIISVERPYTNFLTKEHRYRKCANCFKENWFNLIPCPQCTVTMFCSEHCLTESIKGFHLYECPIADYIWTQCEEFALTLRMVVKAFTTFDSIEELIDFREKNKKTKSNRTAFSFDHTENDLSDKVRYEWVDDLLTNEKFRLKNDMFGRCCKVAILYHYLLENTRFGEILRTEREQDTLMSVILQHTQVSSINCFNCYEYDDVDIDAFMELKPLDVFSRGIYPLSSLFNHSCAPNIATIAAGTKLVAYVTRPIALNEEVMVCYKRLNHFQYDKKTRMESLLPIYNIDCNCVACRCDYPMPSDARMSRGDRTREIGFWSETYLPDLNAEHRNIELFCSILDQNADLYPCLSLFNIGLKLHRALTLQFGNISPELRILLNKLFLQFCSFFVKFSMAFRILIGENSSQIDKAMRGFGGRRS